MRRPKHTDSSQLIFNYRRGEATHKLASIAQIESVDSSSHATQRYLHFISMAIFKTRGGRSNQFLGPRHHIFFFTFKQNV